MSRESRVVPPAVPRPRPFNEAGRQRTSSSRLVLHRNKMVPALGRHIAAKPVRTAARPARAAEQARRNSHSAAAPRLPLHNRSSRGWHQALGATRANRTAGARARGASAASAWAAGGWDEDGESSRPLRAEEVRLVLSSSVAHYETAAYVDAFLTNWIAFTLPGTHAVLNNDRARAETAPLLPPRWREHPRVHESPHRVATAKKFGSLLVAHLYNARHAAALDDKATHFLFAATNCWFVTICNRACNHM